MMNPLSKCTFFIGIFLTLLSIAVPLQVTAESNIPDYYDEPGSSPFRETESGLQNDSVDPFGGQLTVKNIDLFLPGNGGLDLEIVRNYSVSNAVRPGGASFHRLNGLGAMGFGWDIHLGRIWYEDFLLPSGCKSNQVATGSNPVLELSDGSRQVLVNASKYYVGNDFETATNKASPDYISKSFWTAKCISETYTLKGQDYNHGGMEVKSPDGLIYKLNYRARVRQGPREDIPSDVFVGNDFRAWGVTEIRDPRGNWIKVEYLGDGTLFIDQITTSDDRKIVFEYDDSSFGLEPNDQGGWDEDTNTAKRLASISSFKEGSVTADQKVYYQYEKIPGYLDTYDYAELIQVIHDAGSSQLVTNYDYHRSGHGKNVLASVTNPFGGITEYTYQNVHFESAILIPTLAVHTKVNKRFDTGPFQGDIVDTWTYEFIPGSPYDTTIIDGPTKVERYQHFGVRGAFSGNVWKIGSLKQKDIFSVDTNLLDSYDDSALQTDIYEWTSLKISEQNEFRPSRSAVDTFTYVPLLSKHTITRDGSTYEAQYSNYDVLGKPGTVVETGTGVSALGPISKTTNFGYYIDFPQWMILPSQENIQDVGVTFRNYRDDGLVEVESNYGIGRWYEYDGEGNVSRTNDAYNFGINYSNYFRGIPQQEEHEEDITINRVVNNTGTIAEETNGRGYTTEYAYDDMNRITGITPPLNAAIGVDYPLSGKKRVLTRGGMTDTREYDGFGREFKRTVSGEEQITVTKEYDAEGRLTFQSYPNSTLGIDYEYDALGRLTKRTEPDGKIEHYDYLTQNKVRIIDGNSHVKTLYYRSFGNPDQKDLVRIEEEEGVVTDIERDTLGNITRITQDGLERTFEYDAHFFRIAETHPEIGRIDYVLDAVGNIHSREIDEKTTYYDYDNLYRRTLALYPPKKYVDDIEVPLDTAFCNIPCTLTSQQAQDIFSYDKENNTKSSIRRIGGTKIVSVSDIPNIIDFEDDIAWNYTYNENNNLQTETLSVADEAFPLTYGYDIQDSLASVLYPTGLMVDFLPDTYGRPTKAGNFASNIQYHPNGQLAQWQLGNGITNNVGINSRQLPNQIQISGTQSLVGLSYTYDLNDNITQITDSVRPGFSRSLGYDGINRLTSASGQWGSGSINYDTVGNISSKTIGNQTLNYHYDANNQLTEVTGASELYDFDYDGYGNVKDNGRQQFNYDDVGNLLKATDNSVEFSYDANNRRAVEFKEDKARFTVYGQNGQLMYENDAIEGATRDYVYLGSQQIARRDIKPFSPGIEIIPLVSNIIDIGNAATTSVTLEGEAYGADEAEISDRINWTSSIQGDLGNGETVTAILFGGTHTITATATDDQANDYVATYELTVQTTFVPGVQITPLADNFFDLGDETSVTVTLNATAFDKFGVDISSNIQWESSSQGDLGSGASVTAELDEGGHTIYARVADNQGNNYSANYPILALSDNDTVGIILRERIYSPETGYTYGPPKLTFPEGVYIYGKLTSFPGDNTNFFWYIDGESNQVGDGETQYPSSLSVGLHTAHTVLEATWEGFPNIVRTYTATAIFYVGDDLFEGIADAIDDEIDTPENTPVVINILANDITVEHTAGPMFSVTGITQPSNGIVVTTGTSITYTPDTGYTGTDSFTYTISGGDTATVTVTVIGAANQPPIASITAPADGSSYYLGDSITFAGTVSDTEDGDISSGLQWSSNLDGVLGSGATLTLDSLSEGTHTITASSTDSGSLSNTDVITVTVNPVSTNQSPVVSITAPADNSSYSFGDNITLTGTASDAEDGDISSGLQWSSNLDGALGTGTTLTLNTLSEGAHTITATATDSGNLSDSTIITLIVTNNAVNTPPVSVDDVISTIENTPATFDPRTNDSDVNGDALTITAVTQGANGVVTFASTSVTYTPNTGHTGSDSFTYTIDDGNGDTAIGTVTVTITASGGGNTSPVAVSDNGTTLQNEPITIAVLANDTDVNGDALTITSVTQGTNGTVTFTGTNVTYTPNTDFIGTDIFTYVVDDGQGGTDTAAVTITINANGGANNGGETIVFSDDFESDQGWTVNPDATDTATTGLWERGDPQTTTENGPRQLGDTISGTYNLSTGPLAGSVAGSHDIDNGMTSIRSPEITLPALASGESLDLSFYYYLAHTTNGSSADYVKISVVSAAGTTLVYDDKATNANKNVTWLYRTANLNSFAGQTIHLLIEAADEGGGSLVEAALDDVKIAVTTPSYVFNDDLETEQGWIVNPNGTDTATKGQWSRANPESTANAGIKQLGGTVSGIYNLVTGALAGSNTAGGDHDIDGGVTSIRSPDIVLPTLASNEHLALSFAYYFAHTSSSSVDDYLRITLVGESSNTLLYEEYGEAANDDGVWDSLSASLDAHAGETVYLLIEAADEGVASISEAAIDNIQIVKLN